MTQSVGSKRVTTLEPLTPNREPKRAIRRRASAYRIAAV
jgi:hypothetical protein